MQQHRVVVTGIGSISSLGHDIPEIWNSMINGRSGVAEISRADSDMLHVKIAAEVKDYDPADHFEKDPLVYDRFCQFALICARQAIEDSGIDFQKNGLFEETATIIASGVGGWTTVDEAFTRMFKNGRARAHPLTVPRMMISAAASQVTMNFGLRGPAFCVSSACSSGSHAIGEAYWMIRTGRARAAVTGGSEAEISVISQRAWESVRVLARDACRPFSKNRQGMVIAEGAGVIILERLEDALARRAKIYAEICGYGLSADAGDIVVPDQKGAEKAMRTALQSAGMAPEEVSYINAHGTGTQINDAVETAAIRSIFGNHAASLKVSSTKSMHGHALGAAGSLEIVAALKAIETGILPPTINYTEPDPKCDLDYVPNEAQEQPVAGVLSNSLAFGGLNAVIALRKFD
ncbi:MAG: beta-ketoacyl-[acyl-carrier-protein] synthase family protein [Rhodospirillaceae bacterium]|nr:beta-ketoacyl-[acyl-carrier-protein] synthase family protein [Rhodospirillaceae bacterium]